MATRLHLAGIAARLLSDRTVAEASVHDGLQFHLDRMLRSELADSLEA